VRLRGGGVKVLSNTHPSRALLAYGSASFDPATGVQIGTGPRGCLALVGAIDSFALLNFTQRQTGYTEVRLVGKEVHRSAACQGRIVTM
jgi:hypothetical protein